MDHPPLSDPEDESPQGLTSDLAFLSGGGEMGALIRATDWTKTPLGPVKQWPQKFEDDHPHHAGFPLCHVVGMGTGAIILLQRRVPLHLGYQTPMGAW